MAASTLPARSIDPTLERDSVTSTSDASSGLKCPPINLIYLHYHSSIRAELDRMLKAVTALESEKEENLGDRLTGLKRQCRFLEKVYKYHSSVEDEVSLVHCEIADLLTLLQF